jgi:hypothetical protein
MFTTASSIGSSLFSKPWKWSDIAQGYCFGVSFVLDLTKPEQSIDLDTVLRRILSISTKAFLATQLSYFKQHSLAKYCFVGSTAIVAVSNLFIYRSRQQSRLSHRGIEIWNVTPKIEAIMTTLIVFAAARDKPQQAAAFTVVGCIAMLAAKKKLPSQIEKIWSYMPWVRDGMWMYDGDMDMKMFAIFNRLPELGKWLGLS